MRGEEGGWPDLSQTGFTVGCRGAQTDKHATGCRRPKPARSACTGIAGTERSWEYAVRIEQPMSKTSAGSDLGGGD